MNENFGYGIKAEDWDYSGIWLYITNANLEYGGNKWQLVVAGNYMRPIETIEELMVQLDMVSPFVMLGR